MPPRRSTRVVSGASSASVTPEAKPKVRPGRPRKNILPSSPDDSNADDDDEDEDSFSPPPQRTKSAPKAVARKGKRVVKAEPESSDDDMDDFVTAPTSATLDGVSVVTSYHSLPTPPPDSDAVTPTKTPVRVRSESVDDEDEDEDEEGDVTLRVSSPDIPDDVLPPKTPARSGPSHLTMGAMSMATPAPLPISAPAPPSTPKPRLTIHKLVLVNFKSYAGRQEIGPFHKSFSAIVGPNGSGKSNTIDALLFVFGYRASKMRQGKLSELIHNSAGKEGLETCSVEVWFREIVDLPGVDNFLLVPNSQLVVTRTAFRNNSSRYTINDRTSTFTEVTTLLKGKGIDLDHNRFLILQGEVESIALMKAKAQTEHEDGLLEYLEDIIGTTKYKAPIEEESKKVEELNEDRASAMNRLRVVEREKAALEDKKREAESFLRDSNDLTRKKSLLYQFHLYTLQNNIEITTKTIDALTAQLTEAQAENAHHLADIEDKQKGYDKDVAAFAEVKQATDALVKESKKLEKEEVSLQEKKKHLSTKQKKIKKSISDDGHTKSEALATLANCSAEIETNRSKVTELERKLEMEEADLEEVRDSLKDKTDQFTTQIEAKQRELEPWTAKISDKQSAIDVAQSERDLLAEKATSAQTALEEAETAIQSLRHGDKSKQVEYAELKKEAVKTKKSLAEAETKLETMAAQSDQLRAKVSTARQKTDEAKASLAADKSENAVLASLNKLKAQGRIKGFHGRLGDLGVIDDQYDVAVTTACSALNNLVVDTVEQGQACIEHLRKGNVGRASFMVLEKLPPRDLTRIDTPEGVPRLFDLIKPKDPRFAPAFFKGLFNTLVAEDLTQAQRIGYGKKRWRVVTLAGQLIDPSGTMSGGGAKVSRGGMSSKFAADKVEPEVVMRYERDSEAAEQAFATFQTERRAAEQEVTHLRKRLPEIEIAMEKIEMDVLTGAKRIAEAEKRLAELRTQNKPNAGDEKRIFELEGEIVSLTKETNKLREKSTAISEQIKALQNQILEVGGVKLRAIQSKVSTTKGLLDLANDAITKAEVGQAKATRDADKMEKAIASNTVKFEEADAELKLVEGELQACSNKLVTYQAEVEKAQDETTEFQERLVESKKELDAASKDVNAFRKLEMDIKQKIEDNRRVQKDSKGRYKHWAGLHEELELVHIDEDEEEDDGDDDEAGRTEHEVNVVEAVTEVEGAVDEVDGAVDDVEGDEATVAEPVAVVAKKSKTDSLELVEYSPDELRSVEKDLLNAEITMLEEDIAKAKPNMNVLIEYRKQEAEFLKRAQEVENITALRDDAKQRYDDLRKVRLDEFMAGFSAISSKLKEMYQMITMGGNAEIELVDTMDPFSEGVVLSIMPPKKSWRPIANLSGGEKTLASLALVFALHVFKPTPLYFMDEIDAALDFKNVSIVANYIQSKTQAAQFIVISLRNDMFELAHRLVGIYKTSNCTKSIAIDNKDLRSQAVVRKRPTQGDGRNGREGHQVPSTPAQVRLVTVPGTDRTVTTA